MSMRSEEFATKRDKAERIVDWFSRNSSPVYNNYKTDLERKSNIVEYEAARKMKLEGKLNIDNLASVL